MQRVVLATGSIGKLTEMQQTLQEYGFEVLPQSEFDISEALEDGLTFVENALKKARHACRLTGLPSIADDSGLEVDALNGAPGIYSSRYAGSMGDHANNQKLLNALEGQTNRKARFQCVIVYLEHVNDPTPIICHGRWEGYIADTTSGQHGFGYDPLFFVPEYGCTSAELEPAEKQQLSHRGKALTALKAQLKDRL